MSFIPIAHRGFSSQAPENTLVAFDLALNSGFDNIELDVQLTSDKVAVIIHDARVDRTTDGTGEVSSFSLADLRKLDVGSWFNSNYRGERIPTLDEVLKRYDGKVHLHLELKSNDSALPEIVAQVLKDNDWLKYATSKPFAVPGLTITSAHVEQLERSIALLPNVPHHWLSWEISGEIIARAKHLGLEGICIAARYVDVQLIAKAKDKGLTIRGLEVRGDDDIKVLFEAGAEGATTNWPDRVSSILDVHAKWTNIHFLRVFTDSNGNFGDAASVVIDEGRHMSATEREELARRLNTGETIFINDLAGADISVIHPQGEIGFAGVGVLAVAWLLAKLRDKPIGNMHARDGEIKTWQTDNITWARASLTTMPPWSYRQLDSPDAVEQIKLENTKDWLHTMAWAWIDEAKGLIRARTFAADWDIPEAQGNGSGSMVLAAKLGREIEIKHGEGSVIFAKPAPDGNADIGGRVAERAKLLEIDLPGYKADVKPDYLAVGPKLDKLLEQHFMGQDIVLRCIGNQDHPGKTLDELADIIMKTGTDKYDPARKGQGYSVGTDQGKHIDFFGTPVKVRVGTDIFTLELLDDFYNGSLGDRGYAIRIDIVIIYDANKLTKVEHLYGEDIEESDGFVFRDPKNKQDALVGVIKIS